MTEESIQYNYDIIQKLKQVPILESFEENEVHKLLRLSELREYKAGELIFEEGTYDGCIYYLVSGKAKIVKHDKEVSVLKRAGDIFGEMGVLDGSSRSASVYAAEDCLCMVIRISDIEGISDKEPYEFRCRIYKGFAEVLANRLRVTTEELIRTREELEKHNLVDQLIAKAEELGKAKEEIKRLRSGE